MDAKRNMAKDPQPREGETGVHLRSRPEMSQLLCRVGARLQRQTVSPLFLIRISHAAVAGGGSTLCLFRNVGDEGLGG